MLFCHCCFSLVISKILIIPRVSSPCIIAACNDDGGNTRVCFANNTTATGFECRPVCDPDYIDCGDDECRVEHAKAVCRDPCDNLCGSVTEAGIVASTCNRDTGVCQCSNDNTPVARTTTTTTADGRLLVLVLVFFFCVCVCVCVVVVGSGWLEKEEILL